MPNTFELISAVTVGSGGAASIDFTSIPSTYTDLCLKYSLRSDRAGQNNDALFLKINNNMTSLSTRLLEGDGSSAASYSTSSTTTKSGSVTGSTATSSTFANGEIYLPNYAGNTNKSYSGDGVTENNATSAISLLAAGLWSDTAAINQLTLVSGYGTKLVEHSTAYLYGVSNA
jgi:hypothetical protein